MSRIVEMFRTHPDEPGFEECFRVGLESGELYANQIYLLARICRSLPEHVVTRSSQLQGAVVGEYGPRPAFETAESTDSTKVLKGCGLSNVNRVERFFRHQIPEGQDPDVFLSTRFDKMTQCVYPKPITTFESGVQPNPVEVVDIMGRGIDAMHDVNTKYGLGMNEQDLEYFYNFFLKDPTLQRNPTDVEVFHLAQSSSDHSRHRVWNAKITIDGKQMSYSLFDLVREPYREVPGPGNSVLGFTDNASSITIGEIMWFVPATPGKPSNYMTMRVNVDGTCTVETHNHPTRICPGPGAATGIGGCLRDIHAPGRGGMCLFALAGFSTMDLCIPEYIQPWENPEAPAIAGGAQALQIMLEAPMGTWDYGNKYGVPTLLGITRTAQFDDLGKGQRWGYAKPVMLAGQYGYMLHEHAHKLEAEVGMTIVQIGGKAFRIGLGGGTASSQGAGDVSEDLDFASVQRGDAEMGLLTRMVIETCVKMDKNNPIVSIHDQGAAGPQNILTELVEAIGGRINIREIHVGDTSMSVLEIWEAEYQERYGLLIWDNRLDEFVAICEREGCDYEILGKTTGDGRIVVEDSNDGSTPVDFPIEASLAGLPKWELEDTTPVSLASPLVLPTDLPIIVALGRVLRLPVVGSKAFQVDRVDHSVGGKVVQSQRCGPFGLPVADAAVSRFGYFDYTGEAGSLGEQPLKVLLGGSAGVRMAIAEALLNVAGVLVEDFVKIKIQGNVMWPGKKDGELARLYEALDNGVRIFLGSLGICEDGGKDSMSMTAKDVEGALIKSLPTFVATLYAKVPNVRKVVTPDIKLPGRSTLLLIDISNGKSRLGGSALAQVFNQIGEESPDIEDPVRLRNAFKGMQHLVAEGVVHSYHDRSDGGFITALLEMAFAGGCGLWVNLPANVDPIEYLFAEEAGMVFECATKDLVAVHVILRAHDISAWQVGVTDSNPVISVHQGDKELLHEDMLKLRRIWEETSYQMSRLHTQECADEERNDPFYGRSSRYHIPFEVKPMYPTIMESKSKPNVAILRTEGTNGYEEMAAYFFLAGFDVHDVHMSDLVQGRVESLDEFRGIVAPGGFANGDVFGAGRGWAFQIMCDPKLRDMFARFIRRDDSFSLGVCNGCQWETTLGLVPFKDMDIPEDRQPRFIQNTSGVFEARLLCVEVQESPAIMFREMEGARLGVSGAHAEGRLYLPSKAVEQEIREKKLVPLVFIAPDNKPTEQYPYNPNGSPGGITALCDESGQHVVMMPHPERAPNLDNWQYLTEEMKEKLTASPWLKCAQNLHKWCVS
ncbi:phosphoribosylformylglycinamidine synthase [Patescibacteria group bacterium]|nr:phosphoribosylformylglycinamidine synthase [Patescibacteria group bacterium]